LTTRSCRSTDQSSWWGDYLPVSAGLTVPEECRITHLELDQYLSHDEWLNETMVVKAMDFYAANSYQW
jgi:hypothetical protein